MLQGRLQCRLARSVGWQRWLAANANMCMPRSRNIATAASTAAAAAAAGQERPAPLLTGDTLELTCTGLAFGGEGICRMGGEAEGGANGGSGGLVVFVERALPGEQLRARVTQSKRSFARAVKLSTLRQHEAAVQPACEHFGPCGGCTLQSLSYEAQLAAKQKQICWHAGITDVASVLRPAVGCPPGQEYGYRNKMEFSFSSEVWQPVEGEEAAVPAPSTSSRRSSRSSRSERQRRGGAFKSGQREAGAVLPEGGSGAGSSTASSSASSSATSGSGGGAFALGLHRPGSTTVVLPIRRCHLQADGANALLQQVLTLCRQFGLQPYDPVSGTGLLLDVVIRRSTTAGGGTAGPASSSSGGGSSSSKEGSSGAGDSSSDGSGGSSSGGGGGSSSSSSNGGGSSTGGGSEYLLNFVTALDGRQVLAPLAHALLLHPPSPIWGPMEAAEQPAELPPVVVIGVVNTVLQKGRPIGERRVEAEHVLAGRGSLTERLCGLEFEVSANSFFQTNTPQAERLYQMVAAAAELRPSDTLLDLYCGTGSIGLTLSGACRRLFGVEVNPAAVRDAQRNAERNGITNAAFLEGDLHKLQLAGRLPAPDVVIVDPARPGLSPLVVQYLRTCGARRVVYVSCNASTQARDIKALCSGSSGSTEGRGSDDGGGKEDRDSKGSGSSGGGGGSEGRPFRLVSLQACDLYPQTWHVETVAVLDATS